MKNWYKKLYSWLTKSAETKWGPLALLISAFADASFLPIPVTTIFLLLVLLNRERVLKYLLFIIVGTMAGALAGYLIGHYAWIKPNGEFTAVVQFLFDHVPGFSPELYGKVHALFGKMGFWIITSAAATPLPFGLFSITSGIFNINVFIFLIAIFFSQGIKFALLAFFAARLPEFRKKIQLNWKPVAIVSSVSALVVIVLVRIL